MIYDVLTIGAGPSGLYSSLIIKKGTPVQSVSEDFAIKVIEASTHPGGLTKFGFIQITKKWAFHGKNLVGSLYQECVESGIEFSFNERVIQITKSEECFKIQTNKNIYCAKYVIIATGIMTYPDVMFHPEKTNIGLHTPKEMAKEFIENYGWKSVLIAGNHAGAVNDLKNKLNLYFEDIDSYVIGDDANPDDINFGILPEIYDKYDGIIFDYNSYKLKNGTTKFLNNMSLKKENGYLITDDFGETNIDNLYAVGTVTTPTSGVMAAIYSAQIVAFTIGRQLCKTTKADESGRFPFFPREDFWEESYQKRLLNCK